MKEENITSENKMGTMPIAKLLVKMSIPSILSMLVQALYNIVDSIFVSRVSENALTAVSLAFPMQNLMISMSVGIATGICAVISRKLGEGKPDDANRTARTGYTLILICIVICMLLGIFLSGPFIGIYTDDAEILDMGKQYLAICLIVSFGSFIGIFCEKILQATGEMVQSMLVQATGAVFNIIFDPILIFGLLGFPAMGIVGAAVATVAGQIVSMILGIFFVLKNRYVKMHFFRVSIDRQCSRQILAVGIPAAIMMGISTIMTSLLNGILIMYDIVATTVFGVYFKLQSFVFMPVFGLTNGLLPILGYNYGARNTKRLYKALRLAAVVGFVFMSLGTVLFCTCQDTLLGLFKASDRMLEIGRKALAVISLCFPIASVNVITGTVFQALGDGYMSMIVSIIRQLLFLVPLAFIFGKLFGLDAIWFAFLIAEVLACAVTLFFYSKERKKINAQA